MAKFVKGQSGNPTGRPKEDNEIKKLAKEHSREALERLVYWMTSEDPKASVPACNAILDRGYGKPAQAITGPDGEKLIEAIQITFVNP